MTNTTSRPSTSHRAGALAGALALALLVPGTLPACGGGGSGGGGGGGQTAAGSAAPAVQGLRLVALPREALSPSAPGALWILAERPAGVAPDTLRLEASFDGVHFAAHPARPLTAHARSVVFELAWPGQATSFRLAGPVASHPVRVPLRGAIAGTAAGLTLASPAEGALGVPTTPQLSAVGVPGASSFVFVVADVEGSIVWLAETRARAGAVGDLTARAFVDGGALAKDRAHLGAALALDADGFAFAWSPRAFFGTAP